MKNVTAKRLPKFWSSIESDCRQMARFEFVARFVAQQTKTAKGREFTAGLQAAPRAAK